MGQRFRRKVPGLDRAVERLIKWSRSGYWAGHFENIIEAHLHIAFEAVGDDPLELSVMIGDENYRRLLSCAFEDFLTRPDEDDGDTMVEDYLALRGWKETKMARKYLEALLQAPTSLFRIITEEADGKLVLQDTLLHGEEAVVENPFSPGSCREGDYLAARLLDLGNRRILSEGVLCFDAAMGMLMAHAFEPLVEVLHDMLKKDAAKEMRQLAKDATSVRLMTLSLSPSWFSNSWLAMYLQDDEGATDGAPINVLFPLANGYRDEVKRRFRKSECVKECHVGGDLSWFLSGPLAASGDDSEMGEHSVPALLGILVLKEDGLSFAACSPSCLGAGKSLLSFLLGGLIGDTSPVEETTGHADHFEAASSHSLAAASGS